jgi:hypothetical protein
MFTFKAAPLPSGNIGGIVRALELQLGLAAGELGPKVLLALADTVAKGIGTVVVLHELKILYQQLSDINDALDQLGVEKKKKKQLEAQLAAIAILIAEQEAGLTMPPMWKRDP